MVTMATVEKLLKEGTKIIHQREYNNPILDVQLILAHLLQRDRIYLHLHRNDKVDAETVVKFYEMAKKRNEGYPLQYMLNSQEFMGLDFYIKEGIFVPRSDTETLVEKIIKIVNNGPLKNKNIRILDIGTGSGAIAVSLGYYLKNSMVEAMDLDSNALETANINIKKHGLKNVVTFKGDIFNYDFNNRKFDIVVSNPPYIEREEIDDLTAEVSVYEPRLALDGGIDGLNYYRRIVRVFEKVHGESAILSVEIGFNQKRAVTEIFDAGNTFKRIECDKDLCRNDRVVTGFLGEVWKC